MDGEVAFCDLAADPELFNGPEKDIQVRGCPLLPPPKKEGGTRENSNADMCICMQAETYRTMQRLTSNAWSSYVPATNTAWVQYTVDICTIYKMQVR